MDQTIIQLLMIDDDEDDAQIVRGLLSGEHGAHYRLEWASTYHDGLARLCAHEHDICLLDYHLGAHTGLELLEAARRSGCQVPVIVLTGLGADEVDRAAMAAGALDYLSKGELTASHLERSIRYGLQQSNTLQALRHAHEDLEHKVEERTAELAASEELSRRIIESSLDCIKVLNLEGKLLSMSPGGQRLLEIEDLDPYLGQSWINFWNEEDRGMVGEAVGQARAGGVGQFQAFCPTARGTPKWWDVIITPIRGAAGHPERLLAVSRDVTERKQAEEALLSANSALSEANAALAEADRRKDEFLAMLAHELRNPLAPIRNAVHILKTCCTASCAISDQTARQRDMIERQVAHMSRLLDDLLDVSRITRGKIQLKRERLDLRAVAEQAIESMRSQIDARRLTLEWQATSAPLPIEGDPTRLEQVLRNLLHNASKYTAPGGCIWVMVDAEAADTMAWQAVVRVRDSGGGIAPELLKHIFEPFVQAEQSLARTQGGLGIGLSMVKNLVQLHGGGVEAHSQGLDQGSEFVVRLPLLGEMVERSGTAVPAQLRRHEDQAENPRRILVVEDNVDAAASMGELLRIWGHEARTVHDGRQALVVARAWQPEVILLDIGLPLMDGYEVARRLREEPATAGAYLVALTGYGAEEDRRRALEAGFNQHLTKPVELEALQSLLQRAS